MTQARRGHWRTWPEYQFTEDNPEPGMRPSVDALTYKLRHMSMLVDHPDAVEYTIHDMMHWFFIREEPRPTRMFNIMMHANTLWRMALRAETEGEVNAGEGAAYMPDLDLLRARGWEPRPAEPSQAKPEMVQPVDLAKVGITDIISEAVAAHALRGSSNICFCGKEFNDLQEWARHAAIRVKRRLVNEFPPIGQEATEEASASPST